MKHEIFHSIFAFIFGGSLVSLIPFFFKRNDARRKHRSIFYQDFYTKLSEYYQSLFNFLLIFINNNSETSDDFKSAKNNVVDLTNQIEQLNKEIRTNVRRCKKKGLADENTCTVCQTKRRMASELYEKLIDEQKNLDNIDIKQSSFWNIHLDDLKLCARKYSNLSMALSCGGKSPRRLLAQINAIDVKSIELLALRQQDIKNVFDFSNVILSILKLINEACEELSKDIKM